MPDTGRPDAGAPNDPATVALLALSWLLSDGERAGRLLAITGMTVDDLRRGASSPAILAEFLRYLEGHEADLVAAAAATGMTPAKLVDARVQLDRQT